MRIVAATHRDLASMVAEGDFREDLWYRIAVFPIVLPPLRERREDIAELAAHFAERAATRFGLAPVAPKPEDLALLASYSWPGNVRELAAVIDRAAILGDGKRLDVATALGVGGEFAAEADARRRDAGAGTHGTAAQRSRRSCRGCSPRPSSRSTPPSAATSKRRWPSPTDASKAAKAPPPCCKINPHTLRAKMRKLGIDWARFRQS